MGYFRSLYDYWQPRAKEHLWDRIQRWVLTAANGVLDKVLDILNWWNRRHGR